MHHGISTGRQIMNLMSNVKIFVYFFVFCWIKKKGETLWKFCDEISQPFLKTALLKKDNNKNDLIFNTNFNIQRPVQMTLSTQSKATNNIIFSFFKFQIQIIDFHNG